MGRVPLGAAAEAETLDKAALWEPSYFCLVTAARPVMISGAAPTFMASGNRGGGGERQTGQVSRVAQALGLWDGARDAWPDPGSRLTSLS